MVSEMDYRIFEVDQRWYVAFKDCEYDDFVIEFSQSFSSKEEADEAARNGEIQPHDDDGK